MRPSAAVIAALVILASYHSPLQGAALPQAAGYLGHLQSYTVKPNESLIEIARKFDLGYNEICDANPGIDPFIPKPGSIITVPTAWIPPAATQRPAVVINIPEYRLYYFPKNRGVIRTFPLGIGDQGKDTPTGSYRVIEKIPHPSWYVPKSIRAERKELPKVVRPGPDNPMGTHALRLSSKRILIHGTNRPWGIGRRSSHGCLRLYPEDIKELYRLVPKGMRVVIMNEPLKVATVGNTIFVEAHRYPGTRITVARALQLLAQKKVLGRTDFAKVIQAIDEKRGHPVDVTLRLPRKGER